MVKLSKGSLKKSPKIQILEVWVKQNSKYGTFIKNLEAMLWLFKLIESIVMNKNIIICINCINLYKF